MLLGHAIAAIVHIGWYSWAVMHGACVRACVDALARYFGLSVHLDDGSPGASMQAS